jgi:hypothetical protein
MDEDDLDIGLHRATPQYGKFLTNALGTLAVVATAAYGTRRFLAQTLGV